MVYAFREANGGDPIDNDTAEALDEFYATRSTDEKRDRVTSGTEERGGIWYVRRLAPSGQYAIRLGSVERHGEEYFPIPEGHHPGTPQPTLIDAVASLIRD